MFKTLMIGVAVLGLSVGAAFMAGTTYGKQSAAAAGAPGGGANAEPNQRVFMTPGGAPGPDGAVSQMGAFGTISRVDGQTAYVTGPNGQETKVTLTDQTRFEKQAEASLADLKPGARVAVMAQGQAAADGSLTAARVSLVSEEGGSAAPVVRVGGAPGAAQTRVPPR